MTHCMIHTCRDIHVCYLIFVVISSISGGSIKLINQSINQLYNVHYVRHSDSDYGERVECLSS